MSEWKDQTHGSHFCLKTRRNGGFGGPSTHETSYGTVSRRDRTRAPAGRVGVGHDDHDNNGVGEGRRGRGKGGGRRKAGGRERERGEWYLYFVGARCSLPQCKPVVGAARDDISVILLQVVLFL